MNIAKLTSEYWVRGTDTFSSKQEMKAHRMIRDKI
jgi:hypothetical protein